MVDPHLFEEPLLQDLDKEVVSDLVAEFGALVIKKVLDLLRESMTHPHPLPAASVPATP